MMHAASTCLAPRAQRALPCNSLHRSSLQMPSRIRSRATALAGEEPELARIPEPSVPTPPSAEAAAPAQTPSSGRMMLPAPPNLGGKKPRTSWNAKALAFMGDAVWEVYARRKFFHPPTHMATYYQSVVQSVRAEKQAEMYTQLVKGEYLSAEERDVLRWGRNATGSTSPKRFGQAGISREMYRAATAVECLVGYLYLTDPQRLDSLMNELGMGSDGV